MTNQQCNTFNYPVFAKTRAFFKIPTRPGVWDFLKGVGGIWRGFQILFFLRIHFLKLPGNVSDQIKLISKIIYNKNISKIKIKSHFYVVVQFFFGGFLGLGFFW